MKRILFAISILPLISFFGCQSDVLEMKEDINSAVDQIIAENNFTSTFDAAFDIIATNAKMQKSGTTIIPDEVRLNFVDSLFSDGDGVELIIQFGSMGTTIPHGVLCQDGNYRSGQLRILVNQSIRSAEFRAEVISTEKDSFCVGNGAHMVQQIGRTMITLENQNGIRLRVLDGIIKDDSTIIRWDCDRTVIQTKDGSLGIWGDEYEMTGTSHVYSSTGETFTATITSPLIKKIEAGCARAFVAGRMDIQSNASNQHFEINYDPFNNQACDQLVETAVMGKKSIVALK